MKRILVLLIIVLISIIVISISLSPLNFFNNIIDTLKIWLYKVYPSIFTFYLLASLLINSKIINKIIYLFKPILKHLKFKNERSLHLFILSVFIGNPSSSSLICEGLQKKDINMEEANNLLKYSSFLNPLFIISFMLAFSIKYAFIVILVHVCSNIIIAIYSNKNNDITIINNEQLDFSLDDFLESVNNVINILLMISSVMVFCSIIIYSIDNTLNYFSISSTLIDIIISNLEVSLGLHRIVNMNLNIFTTVFLICFVTSFAGFSIHLQVYNIINKYKLKYSIYFKYRIIQGIIASLLFTILFSFF